jgi:poly(3-hydroxybutyrate) depolymerase
VFNGSRFRAEIAPRIADFVLSNNGNIRRSAGKRAANAVAAPKINGAAHKPTAPVGTVTEGEFGQPRGRSSSSAA